MLPAKVHNSNDDDGGDVFGYEDGDESSFLVWHKTNRGH